MDRQLIEKYEKEMMEMYASVHTAAPQLQISEITSLEDDESSGGLIVSVTTARGLYPVSDAMVTVFSTEEETVRTVDSDKSDMSGKTKTFLLPTPAKSLSESVGAEKRPYAVYDVTVEADGYVKQRFIKIPVFSGVTSLQKADLLSLSAAGGNVGERIIDEGRDYDL